MAKKNFLNFCLLLKFVLNAPVLSLFVEQFSTEEDESWQGRSRKLSVIRALVSCRSNEDKCLLLHENRLCIISPTRSKNSHKLSSNLTAYSKLKKCYILPSRLTEASVKPLT